MPLVVGGKTVASLKADIGANVAPFQQGAGVVKSELNTIGKQMGQTAQQSGAMMTTIAGAAIAIGAAFVDAYNETAKYNEQVRDLSLVSGQSAEETSKFIQVLDDYQLTADDATKAAKALKEKGLSPTVDTLIDLSNQFKAIQDPAERLAFVQDNLGKGGAKWVNILNQEQSALEASVNGVNKYLIKTDEMITKSEIARLAIDNIKDSVEGYKNAVGDAANELIVETQASNMAYKALADQGIQINSHTMQTQEYKNALAAAKEEQLKGAEASLQYAESLKESEQAAKDLSTQLSRLVSLTGNIQKADEDYTSKSKDLADQRAETLDKLAALRAQGYWEQSDQIQGELSKLDEIKTKEQELATEREKQSLQFISNILAEQLARGGWTQTEFDAFAKQQEAWGLWSADAVAKSQAAWQEADKITASINAIPDKTVNINIVQHGTTDVYGSGTGLVGANGGGVQHAHAGGGSFVVGAGAGNEGMNIGGRNTVSSGETVTVTPRGGEVVDYDKLARVLVAALQAVG